MSGYRLYFLDDQGHIVNHAEWLGEDDGEAEQQAAAQHDGRAMELWSGKRVVRRFDRRMDA